MYGECTERAKGIIAKFYVISVDLVLGGLVVK